MPPWPPAPPPIDLRGLKNINHITVDDMSEFFIKAHHKVSKLDKERGMTCIEKHRHDQLITVINKIYKYAKVSNPITSISFDTSDYPYYSLDKLEDPEGYSKEDITKLLNVFDSLTKSQKSKTCYASNAFVSTNAFLF